MKIKSLKGTGFKAKVIVSTILLALLILSFFFSEKLEDVLNMNVSFAKNETSFENLKNSDYKIHYIDVGQGNSSLIELPDGKTILIDGGNTMYGETVSSFLKERNVDSVDYLIATHADSDHIGGLVQVLKDFEVKNIFRPFQIAGTGTNAETFEAIEQEDLKEVYEHYAQKSSRNKISRVTSNVFHEFVKSIYLETYTNSGVVENAKVSVFYDGLKIVGENYILEFFAPLIRDESVDLSQMTSSTFGYATKGYGVGESNDNSAVFLFKCFSDTYLFTGDASCKNGETSELKPGKFEEIDFVWSLTNEEKVRFSNVTVYLAGHHGSSYSSSEILLELINPKFVIFSVGANNTYGHPASEVIFRIGKTKNIEPDYLLRTDENGTISFGNVSGDNVYAVSKTTTNNEFLISWKLFAIILFLALEFVLFSIKPKNKQKLNFIDTDKK